jgi:hypothetical protein
MTTVMYLIIVTIHVPGGTVGPVSNRASDEALLPPDMRV